MGSSAELFYCPALRKRPGADWFASLSSVGGVTYGVNYQPSNVTNLLNSIPPYPSRNPSWHPLQAQCDAPENE